MSIKGGYLIVDLGGQSVTLGSGYITVPGIYDKIEGNYGKPILLSGIVIGGVEQDDTFAWFRVSGTYFEAHAAGLLITITDDDYVYIQQDAAGGVNHITDVTVTAGTANYDRNGADYADIELTLSYTQEDEEEGQWIEKPYHFIIPIDEDDTNKVICSVPLIAEEPNRVTGETFSGTYAAVVTVSPTSAQVTTGQGAIVSSEEGTATSLPLGMTVKVTAIK